MIYRIYVESKTETDSSAQDLLHELQTLFHITGLTGLRILKRYDLEGIEASLLPSCIDNVFSQPPLDDHFFDLELSDGETAFAVGYLPGQFDQRAESAATCIQMLSQVEKPRVRYATVYLLQGHLEAGELAKVKSYLINPVDSEEKSLELPESLELNPGQAAATGFFTGFIDLTEPGLQAFLQEQDLAMDLADLKLVQAYFQEQGRDLSQTELKVIDTYWSDHCRHTTFNTELTDIEIEDDRVAQTYAEYLKIHDRYCPQKSVSLMNMANIAMRKLRAEGKLSQLDESDEINACTIKIEVDTAGGKEDWLLLFKNETHNHPTEIEPFGGAATCIGGAIRDPLSGRAYVYAAMRISGAASPLQPVEDTLPGKLPQRTIVKEAAEGYSSYGNQIGLATSLVEELYHPSYVAKHLELGAVVGAVKADHVKREKPLPGDLVLLIGGRTGRDGIGGATGSSKSHQLESVELCGAQVQKGNALEERKLQRLFRKPEVSRAIKKCNDFGAGGVAVAVGELADGLDINLDKLPKKYAGLSATDLAISESQERMALVIAPADLEMVRAEAAKENIEATVIAKVTAEPVLKMTFSGRTVVEIKRSFLDTNGAAKTAAVRVPAVRTEPKKEIKSLAEGFKALLQDPNNCSKAGLIEQFDSSIGSGSILMPLGGKYQKTPTQVMVNRIPVLDGETGTCSIMAYGFRPSLAEQDPYFSAYAAVLDSVYKILVGGADPEQVHLSLQEYFPSLRDVPERWGLPFAAMQGAIQAQLDLEVAAIGGKDSMSGSFEDRDVVPTLISFAISLVDSRLVISPEFKAAQHPLYLVKGRQASRDFMRQISRLVRSGKVLAGYSLTTTSVAEALLKMALGNRLGVELDPVLSLERLFAPVLNGFLLELEADLEPEQDISSGLELVRIGHTQSKYELSYGASRLDLADLESIYDQTLEPVYPTKVPEEPVEEVRAPECKQSGHKASYPGAGLIKPRVLIPVFPGSNCEYDSARVFERAGAEVDFCLVRNLTVDDIKQSLTAFAGQLKNAQLLFIPGGFSAADEPDGSAKFICSFMRNEQSAEAIQALLDRAGLIGGICNGFQALIKLGLLPYGRILKAEEHMSTLAANTIKRHQSKIVNIRVVNNASPWLQKTEVGEVYQVPISHGEGRLVGQVNPQHIATQYCDPAGNPSRDIIYCPNQSQAAIEGLISEDGRIFGKMGHAERLGIDCYKNVPGRYDMKLFESAVDYFKKS